MSDEENEHKEEGSEEEVSLSDFPFLQKLLDAGGDLEGAGVEAPAKD